MEFTGISLPLREPSTQQPVTKNPTSASASLPCQIPQEAGTEKQSVPSGQTLLGLSIRSSSGSKGFKLFPTLPAELCIRIWSHAILSLPERIIPIREITGKARAPAYFTASRPHPLFVSINRKARDTVFSTLQPLIFVRRWL